MNRQIFISYRRDDSGWAASNIYSDLVRRFRGKVFMDVDSIPVGADFVAHLQQQVDRCNVLVALIGENWATPRLRDRRDFVRVEIERALDTGKPVVPVLLDDARMPSESEVPYGIDGLLSRQAIRLRRDSYRIDFPHLVEQLRLAAAPARRFALRPSWLPIWRARSRRPALEAAFGDRVHADVLEELARGASGANPYANEIRQLTVMSCSAVGFSSVAETMAAQDAIACLADLMTPFTDAIIRRRGTVDKCFADSILAFWNAPLDDRTPEANACAAVLDLQDAVARINEEFAHRGIAKLPASVALATGECVVGPMGSRRRFEYSCFGGTVDLAARIESLARVYGVWQLIDERTARAVDKHFAVLEIDAVGVKGKSDPVRIYALIGDESVRASADYGAFKERYVAGRMAYLVCDWDRAEAAYQAAADCSVEGIDTQALCQAPLARIEAFREHPPPENWDGVFRTPGWVTK